MRRRLVTAVLVAWSVTASGADAPPPEPPRVVVRGTPLREGLEPPADVGAFGTVLDTRAAPQWTTTLGDVLDDAVGVRVRRFGGLGDFTTVSVRGFSPGQLQVYLDGVPLSRASDETVDLSDLPVDAIERIDVYRGVTPLDFAQSGPGGVVNVVPRRPEGEPLLAASVGVGSFGTRKATLAHGATVGDWDYVAFAQYLGGEGDFWFTDDRGTPQTSDDRRVERQNADFNGGGFTARVRRQVGRHLSLRFTSDTFAKEHGVPGRGSVQSTDARRRVFRQLVALNAAADWQAPVPIVVDAGTFLLYQEEWFRVPLGDPAFAVPRDDTNRSWTVGGQVVARAYPGAGQVPGLLAAISHEEFDQRDEVGAVPASGPGDAPTRTRLRTTLGAEDEMAFAEDRVTLVPSLRWEHYRDDFPGDPRLPGTLAVGGTSSNDVLAPRLALRLDPVPGVTVLGNIARYERVPNLRELYGTAGLVVGDPDLDPECVRTWDVGARLRLPQPGWVDDAQLEYAYFDSRIDDAIVLVPSAVNLFRPENVAAARVRGHELALGVGRGALRVTANYTYQDARDLGEDRAFFDGKQLPGRPRHDVYGRVDLDWAMPAWVPLVRSGHGFYDVSFLADNYLDRANLDRVDERLLFGVGVEFLVPGGVRVAAEVRNLTDDQTRDVADFPLPGRSAFVTVSYGFGSERSGSP